ncbi:ATP-binding cassette domain-containing protein [Companilactobacillus metriopterae]|uniref:ATP-binding cassette domain-containing protein n=1 Tax=Companilactobacillus metriopterae TaxID=1909267 RepID=UPI00100B4E53|nr:ABC transporter ATP-binding protein [Companilactobacillus metriopterae]
MISNFLSGNFKKVCLIAVITTLRSLLLLLSPLISKVIIDTLLPQKKVHELILLVVFLILIPIITNKLIDVDLKLSTFVLENISRKRTNFVDNYLDSIENKEFTDNEKLHILTFENDEISNYIYRNLGSLLWLITTISLGIVLIIYFNVIIGLVLIIIMLIQYSSMYFLYGRFKRLNNSYTLSSTRLLSSSKELYDSLKNQKISSGIKKKQQEDIIIKNNKVGSIQRKISFSEALISILNTVLSNLSILFIFLIGLSSNSIPLGNLIAIYQMYLWLVPALSVLAYMVVGLGEVSVPVGRFFKLTNSIKFTNNDRKNKIDNLTLKSSVYLSNKIRLNRDIQLKKNQNYLLTGDVGSGKSTLLKYAFDPAFKTNVKIIVDQNNKSLRNSNGYLNLSVWYSSENPSIFDTTLISNIYFKKNISDKEEEFVKSLPFNSKTIDRLDNVISKDTLSGGERQLIEISRLLVSDVDYQVILLDEALSSMNADLERNMLEKIIEKYPNSMIIIVSHRDTIDSENFIKLNMNNYLTKDI